MESRNLHFCENIGRIQNIVLLETVNEQSKNNSLTGCCRAIALTFSVHQQAEEIVLEYGGAEDSFAYAPFVVVGLDDLQGELPDGGEVLCANPFLAWQASL